MGANKEQCKAAGSAFVSLLLGVKDGIDLTDAVALQDFVAKVASAADDFKDDSDAAIAYALSGATETFGDSKVDAPE